MATHYQDHCRLPNTEGSGTGVLEVLLDIRHLEACIGSGQALGTHLQTLYLGCVWHSPMVLVCELRPS